MKFFNNKNLKNTSHIKYICIVIEQKYYRGVLKKSNKQK